jgi:hypothetical protein
MFSPFCLGELTAECPWSTLQSGTGAVHMNALRGKKGKLPGERLPGLYDETFKPKS